MLADAFVPLFTYPEETAAEALPQLVQLLETFATRVTYCGVEIDIPNLADSWGAHLAALPQMVAEIERRSLAKAVSLIDQATALKSKLEVGTSRLRAAFADPGLAVSAQARYHDITAMQMRPGSENWKAVAEHLLFGSGRPLLLVPMETALPSGFGHVALAWDGRVTANRAIYDAMPLITQASQVTILTAGSDKDINAASIDALRHYLQRHGIEPRLVEASSTKRGIGADLQTAALAEKADLLIMGAYGHSRLREFVLGGATAGVLGRTAMPVFMSR